MTMNRDGFSLIEIMVGMLVFALGVLALTASTGYVSMQIQAADVRTERSVAVQRIAEQLHATEYDDLASRSKGDALSVGEFDIWWDVQSLGWGLSEVDLYSEGPGFSGGRRIPGVGDTLIIRIARPMK